MRGFVQPPDLAGRIAKALGWPLESPQARSSPGTLILCTVLLVVSEWYLVAGPQEPAVHWCCYWEAEP